jgi:hypothetical protein
MNDQRQHYSQKLEYEIDAWDLKAALDAGESVVVVDARSAQAYRKEHIPGGICIPHRTMSAETTRRLERTALVVSYCDGIWLQCLHQRPREPARSRLPRRDGYRTEGADAAKASANCGCG